MRTIKKPIKQVCIICSNYFKIYPHQKQLRKYCSRKCYYKSLKERKITWGNKISKTNKGHFKNYNTGRTWFKKGDIPWNKGLKGIFVGKKASNWQGGISFEPYPLGWTKTYKEQIRYRDGYKCQNPECGIPEVECNRKLDVHHIDYDKNNILPINLISLCNSCHMKTNGNRNYWIIYFRKIKYEKINNR